MILFKGLRLFTNSMSVYPLASNTALRSINNPPIRPNLRAASHLTTRPVHLKQTTPLHSILLLRCNFNTRRRRSFSSHANSLPNKPSKPALRRLVDTISCSSRQTIHDPTFHHSDRLSPHPSSPRSISGLFIQHSRRLRCQR